MSGIWKRARRPRLLALLLLLTAGATWLWAHEGHQPLPTRGAAVDLEKGTVALDSEAVASLDLATEEVGIRPAFETVQAPASLHVPWDRHAYAGPRLGGRVVSLHARPGQVVKAGQLLAEVESLELKGLALELRTFANELRLAEQALSELRAASRGGALPEQRLIEGQTRQRQARHALELARSKWLATGGDPGGLEKVLAGQEGTLTVPVRSPLAGVIIHADQTTGKVVEPAEHLFEIMDLKTVQVRIGVLERDLHRVAVGQQVELTLTGYPGEVFPTEVRVLGADLDDRTHLSSAWGELPNPSGQEPRFLPGMTGVARVRRPVSAKTMGVPLEALVSQGAETFVFVEESSTAKEGVYRKRAVVVLGQDDRFAFVRPGDLYLGERIVTRGSSQLSSFFVPGVLRPGPEMAAALGLEVAPAGRHLVEDVVEVEGSVEVPPDQRVLVSSPLAGTLVKVHVARGQQVKQGDLLAEVASAELQNLQLELLRAHLDGELAKESLRRLREAGDSLPRRLWVEAEGQQIAARNRHDALARKLALVGLTPAQLNALRRTHQVVESVHLRAARGGVVVRQGRVLGQGVKAEEPVFEVHDLSHVWVRLHLAEGELSRVRAGQRARVRLTAYPGRVLHGSVTRSARRVDPDSQQLAAWVELEQTESEGRGLLHNLLARVTLPGARQGGPVLAVPKEALVHEGSRVFVFVRAAEGTFAPRNVRIGRADDRLVEIVEGLEPGEPVAVRGAAGLWTGFTGLR